MTDEHLPPAGAAPGWYPQSDGTAWYWDGRQYTEHKPAADLDAAARKRRTWNVAALGIVGAALVVTVLAIVVTHKSSEEKASDACRSYIEDRLKAPSTADFSDEHAQKNADTGFKAYGTVDSENGFGAKVRTTYVCYVTDGYSVVRAETSED